MNSIYKIGIIGMGYVGLNLAYAFANKYFVLGFDINKNRILELKKFNDVTCEFSSDQLKETEHTLTFSSQIEDIADCNVYIISVPTPVNHQNDPDLKPLTNVSETIANVLNKGDIIIYESTVYPGVTEDICVPILEKHSKLIFNEDFFVGYSPERINVGDKKYKLTNIVKVTSGSTPEIATKIDDLYKSIITAGTHKASSIKVAEASKVIENIQRDVNIALVNELALIFNILNINTREVLDAAQTKWNFNSFFPGLVGGHCIGVDPYYLSYKAKTHNYTPKLILASRQINNNMGKFISEQTVKTMLAKGKKINNANILLLGITFKEDCPDIRNSGVFNVINDLVSYQCNVDVYDPYISQLDENTNFNFTDNPFERNKLYDAIVLLVGHKEFKKITMDKYKAISLDEPIFIDIKGILTDPTWSL